MFDGSGVGLVSVRLGQLMECSGVLPTTQFAYRKGLCSVFCVHTLSGRTGSALVWHSEGRTIEALSVQ